MGNERSGKKDRDLEEALDIATRTKAMSDRELRKLAKLVARELLGELGALLASKSRKRIPDDFGK